ncbi:MAG: glycoside hydrolase family 127 protein [Clostridia bacterium]|nr:glycoside hydrolase family 127 protein [Clostridia bacterium]
MLKSNKYTPFTTKEIKPRGWLLRQLRIQADGLSGNLQKVWPDIRDSQWIGGDKEGWERVPYWLDGFIPLAFLLEDKALIADAKKYVDFIIGKQYNDPKNFSLYGWICPFKTEFEWETFDEWAVLLISKTLFVWYDCTGDERIPDVEYKIFKNLYWRLGHFTMKSWANYRWFEGLIALYRLYELRPEDWMLELAHRMWEDGHDYHNTLRYERDVIPHYEKSTHWRLDTHVVNLAMALKSEALASRFLNCEGRRIDPDEFATKLLAFLQKHHGNLFGYFNGDECISGTSPIRGTELCGVVEAMYSYEVLFSISGNPKWLDLCELLGYNMLPATCSEDMWSHQYNQMVNQICCPRFETGDGNPFLTNDMDGNLFGLEPNYGCCTSNFSQGFPKLALATYYRSENGVVSAVIAPSTLETEINGAKVKITLDTKYPFGDTLTYTVKTDKAVGFDFGIRIPEGADKAYVDGMRAAPQSVYTLSRKWSRGETTVTVKLEQEAKLIFRPNDLCALRRGALVYSLPIKSHWKKWEHNEENILRKFPYCDYIVTPRSKWNYSFASDEFRFVEKQDEIEVPFSEKDPPVYAYAQMSEIDWGTIGQYGNNVCNEVPNDRTPIGKPKKMKLIPYGCAKLRMTEMPMQKQDK